MAETMWNRRLSFKQPVIGNGQYLAPSSSGWMESFDKKACDEALASFIGEMPLDELADNFIEGQRVRNVKQKRKETQWTDVTRYLARIFDIDADSIPIDVAIAFWAYTITRGKS